MDKVNNTLKSLGLDGFLLAILVMVLLAYFIPGPGLASQPISLAELANFGISGIFFFYGLKLNGEKLKKGLANWRMHVVIQLTTFLIFPILALLVKPFFSSETAQNIWLGIFFLAALPSTVSSSVVMVSMAGGNIPSAIFNASISALIGVFITPLWIGLFLKGNLGNFDSSSVFLKLTVQVLIPVVIGILLNKRFGSFAEKHKKSLKQFDQAIILVIIYTSFCKSFSEHLFSSMTFLQLFFLAAGMLTLFLCIMLFVKIISRSLHFTREDSITVMFCGSKKSLVHGTVMSGILFAGNPLTGIILLPLMLYHALQLIAASILAKKMASSQI